MTSQISAELAAIIAVADDGTHTQINEYGTKIWCNADGQIHRDGDLPAVIFANGSVYYYQNDEMHRDGDFPAVIHISGFKSYWKNDVPCRDGDLPAVVWVD